MPSSDKKRKTTGPQHNDKAPYTLDKSAQQGDAHSLLKAEQHIDTVLRQLFADAQNADPQAALRPSPEELIAYVDGILDEPRRQFVEECAKQMPDIQAEIDLLRQLGSNPLT